MKTRIPHMYEPGYLFWLDEGKQCVAGHHWKAAASAYELAIGLAPTQEQKNAATVLRDACLEQHEEERGKANGPSSDV